MRRHPLHSRLFMMEVTLLVYYICCNTKLWVVSPYKIHCCYRGNKLWNLADGMFGMFYASEKFTVNSLYYLSIMQESQCSITCMSNVKIPFVKIEFASTILLDHHPNDPTLLSQLNVLKEVSFEIDRLTSIYGISTGIYNHNHYIISKNNVP